ncbi:metal-dependent hydrolase [Paraurantiacibacter namhicola]|nr:metal-dependent hydrolase [Paraurantiacibacter namhicola]
MTHAVVPLAAAALAGRGTIPPKVALAGSVLAMLPDADVIGLRFGVDYADAWGHRGATHSLAIAGLVAAAIAAVWTQARNWPAFLFLFLATASHGLLDMLTDGGLGVGLLWPASEERLFWPVTPVRVSPIGAGFFSMRGVETLASELVWIWLPAGVLAAIGIAARRRRA